MGDHITTTPRPGQSVETAPCQKHPPPTLLQMTTYWRTTCFDDDYAVMTSCLDGYTKPSRGRPSVWWPGALAPQRQRTIYPRNHVPGSSVSLLSTTHRFECTITPPQASSMTSPSGRAPVRPASTRQQCKNRARSTEVPEKVGHAMAFLFSVFCNVSVFLLVVFRFACFQMVCCTPRASFPSCLWVLFCLCNLQTGDGLTR